MKLTFAILFTICVAVLSRRSRHRLTVNANINLQCYNKETHSQHILGEDKIYNEISVDNNLLRLSNTTGHSEENPLVHFTKHEVGNNVVLEGLGKASNREVWKVFTINGPTEEVKKAIANIPLRSDTTSRRRHNRRRHH
jgi:hypothetical protein